jgi:hypothetical protein
MSEEIKGNLFQLDITEAFLIHPTDIEIVNLREFLPCVLSNSTPSVLSGASSSTGESQPFQTVSVARPPTSPAYSHIDGSTYCTPADRSISPVNSEEYFNDEGTLYSYTYDSVNKCYPKFFVKDLNKRKEYAHYESDDWILGNGEPFVYSEDFSNWYTTHHGKLEVLENKSDLSEENYSSTSASTTEEDSSTGSDITCGACTINSYKFCTCLSCPKAKYYIISSKRCNIVEEADFFKNYKRQRTEEDYAEV